MRIYHGSLEVVEHPLILPPQRTLDYGQGFYTTTSERQSKEWVERRMHEKHTSCGYVNIYELDEEKLCELKCLIFEEPNEEWAEFVMANRTRMDFAHDTTLCMGLWPTTEFTYNLAYMRQARSAWKRSYENSKHTSWSTNTFSIPIRR